MILPKQAEGVSAFILPQGTVTLTAWPSLFYDMTDSFYNSKKWRRLRQAVLARDRYMDQLELRTGRKIPADTVHHIFPKDKYPQYKWCSWNLISLSRENHEAMHIRLTSDLTNAGKQLLNETASKRGIKLSMVTLVVGLPGSGKTTYTRHVMGGGLVYDLDYIAAAFRLRSPHSERHDPARRMANSMAKAFSANAQRYASDVFVIRTAPDIDEVVDLDPDTIVVCEGTHDITSRSDYVCIDQAEAEGKIKILLEWAEVNDVPVTRIP